MKEIETMLKVANIRLCHKDICHLIEKDDKSDFGRLRLAYFEQKMKRLTKSSLTG